MTKLSQITNHLWLKAPTGIVITLILSFTIMSLEINAFEKRVIFFRNVAHDGFDIADDQLADFEAESKMTCVMLCNENELCKSISYNSLSMRCQHFLVEFWNRPVTGTMESGWLHYDRKYLYIYDL